MVVGMLLAEGRRLFSSMGLDGPGFPYIFLFTWGNSYAKLDIDHCQRLVDYVYSHFEDFGLP